MDLTNEQIARTISCGDFMAALDRLDEEVRWEIVGDKTLQGKASVTDFCKKTAAYFASVTLNVSVNNVIVSGDLIAIDGKAEFIDSDGGVTRLASSDIYRFRGQNLVEITSYCVPLASE